MAKYGCKRRVGMCWKPLVAIQSAMRSLFAWLSHVLPKANVEAKDRL